MPKTPPAELEKARQRMRRRRENPEFRKREQAEWWARYQLSKKYRREFERLVEERLGESA